MESELCRYDSLHQWSTLWLHQERKRSIFTVYSSHPSFTVNQEKTLSMQCWKSGGMTTTTTTVLRHFFWDHPGWASANRELLDFTVQGKINRGRHTDHPAGRHSIRTNQCLPPHSPPFFTDWMPFPPPNQQCQSTEGKLVAWVNTKLKLKCDVAIVLLLLNETIGATFYPLYSHTL